MLRHISFVKKYVSYNLETIKEVFLVAIFDRSVLPRLLKKDHPKRPFLTKMRYFSETYTIEHLGLIFDDRLSRDILI